jgi:hypothetical protein
MKPDKESLAPTDEKQEKLPSQTVENAHAAGDGALERSDEPEGTLSGGQTSEEEAPY